MMKIAMVVLYLYSGHGGLTAHDHFLTLGECEAAADEVRKLVKWSPLRFVCIPQMPDKWQADMEEAE